MRNAEHNYEMEKISHEHTKRILKACEGSLSEAHAKNAAYKEKADKWDILDQKISEFYDENNPKYAEGGLDQIGEIAAIAFDYL